MYQFAKLLSVVHYDDHANLNSIFPLTLEYLIKILFKEISTITKT